ncbi:putative Ig domain-containing protein [Deinococcus sp.]|uniref:putative Ig domain-containing protein n=1 Tax=Deinococcus sp. TaxID=47478 RepID=UPI003B5C0897
MNRLLPALLGASLLLGACGSGTTPGSTSSSSSTDLLSLSTAALPPAYVGDEYTGSISPTGGVAPYSVRLISGALPEGLEFSGGGSATISGTPTKAGSAKFTLEVSDANLSVRNQEFNLQVTELPPLDFALTLPPGELRGETRVPLRVVGPRQVRAARYTWALPEDVRVTKVVSEAGNDSGRPLMFWRQKGRVLTLDFGFRLPPKNGAQVAMITLAPAKDKAVNLSSATDGGTASGGPINTIVAQDGEGKVLRDTANPAAVQPPAPSATPSDGAPPADPSQTGDPAAPGSDAAPAPDAPATDTPAPDTAPSDNAPADNQPEVVPPDQVPPSNDTPVEPPPSDTPPDETPPGGNGQPGAGL